MNNEKSRTLQIQKSETMQYMHFDFADLRNISSLNSPTLSLYFGAVYILRNTGKGGRGLPDLLQYYIGGFFKAYYNITDLVGIWKGLDHFQYYICFYVMLIVRIWSQIWKNLANIRF